MRATAATACRNPSVACVLDNNCLRQDECCKVVARYMLSSNSRPQKLRDDKLPIRAAHQLVSQAHAKSITREASATACNGIVIHNITSAKITTESSVKMSITCSCGPKAGMGAAGGVSSHVADRGVETTSSGDSPQQQHSCMT